VDVLVCGSAAETIVAQAAQLGGVRTVLYADAPFFRDGGPENATEVILRLASRYGYILFAATAWGKSVAPRLAAKLDVAQISDVTAILDGVTFERPIYAGNAIATLRSTDAIKVMTVRMTAFQPTSTTGGQAVVERVDPGVDTGKSRVLSREVVKNDRPELGTAKIVVSGGRALGSGEAFQRLLAPLADKLGGALGASRAAVDAGYAPNDWQVGQTGKIVAPQLYLAIGISGAIQHLAGMKDSRIIVAINKDPEAPIFTVADYSLQADLFVAVPQLIEALG
jgi:electron transfer flavoprotein alpha subunit